MNYFGGKAHKKEMKQYELFFDLIDLAQPTGENILSDKYKCKYYYVEEESVNPYISGLYGYLCQLYENDKLIYEWKSYHCKTPIISNIIHHNNGYNYIIFKEDLYGYSVLELETLKSIHYLPTNYNKFEETFIWCNAYYNQHNNLLAVGGCFWAANYDVIVIDFSNPLEIQEINKWKHVSNLLEVDQYNPSIIDFKCWDKEELVVILDDKKEIKISLKDKM